MTIPTNCDKVCEKLEGKPCWEGTAFRKKSDMATDHLKSTG